jgi:hypothetical protein
MYTIHWACLSRPTGTEIYCSPWDVEVAGVRTVQPTPLLYRRLINPNFHQQYMSTILLA